MSGEKPREVKNEINFEKDPNRKIPDGIKATPEEIQSELEKEEELSPEIVQKVMEKVRDIDEKGLAYTTLAYSVYLEKGDHDPELIKERLKEKLSRFKSVLSLGIQGSALKGHRYF